MKTIAFILVTYCTFTISILTYAYMVGSIDSLVGLIFVNTLCILTIYTFLSEIFPEKSIRWWNKLSIIDKVFYTNCYDSSKHFNNISPEEIKLIYKSNKK